MPKRPMWKHAVTVLVAITSPIWIFPLMVLLMAGLLWAIADHALWDDK
jgi:hypothetical protein